MPRCRHFPNLFVEIVLFVSLFTLLGHVSVNFWERYMIQTELTKMKTSLHGLRYTIDVIGNAYDNLHEELKFLADVSEPKGKGRSIYTDKILESPQPNHILAHSDSGRVTKNPPNPKVPQTANVIKDIYAQASVNGHDQFTITDNTDRADKIATTPSTRDKVLNTDTYEKKSAKTFTANPIDSGNSPRKPSESIKTNTRNPLISTAAGRGSAHNREIQTYAHCKQRDPYNSKIHQCHRDEIAIDN